MFWKSRSLKGGVVRRTAGRTRRRELVLERLEDRTLLACGNASLGCIEGQAFFDRDGNGDRDGADPGLDGQTVRLFDNVGYVVASTAG